MDLPDKKVLIAGGRVGIGKAIVAELVRYDVRDITVRGRRPKLLDALTAEFPGVSFLPFSCPKFKDRPHFEG